MSPLEHRAWLHLWGLGPAYLVYFGLQALSPAWLSGMIPRLALLGAVTLVHAGVYVVGLLVLKWRERREDLLVDERDQAIEAQATKAAYYLLQAGFVLVGVIAPFSAGGWKIVNGALMFIVLAEALRSGLTIRGYRGSTRLAR
jgi:hypothetical protein